MHTFLYVGKIVIKREKKSQIKYELKGVVSTFIVYFYTFTLVRNISSIELPFLPNNPICIFYNDIVKLNAETKKPALKTHLKPDKKA